MIKCIGELPGICSHAPQVMEFIPIYLHSSSCFSGTALGLGNIPPIYPKAWKGSKTILEPITGNCSRLLYVMFNFGLSFSKSWRKAGEPPNFYWCCSFTFNHHLLQLPTQCRKETFVSNVNEWFRVGRHLTSHSTIDYITWGWKSKALFLSSLYLHLSILFNFHISFFHSQMSGHPSCLPRLFSRLSRNRSFSLLTGCGAEFRHGWPSLEGSPATNAGSKIGWSHP